jgi:hypothetical protein
MADPLTMLRMAQDRPAGVGGRTVQGVSARVGGSRSTLSAVFFLSFEMCFLDFFFIFAESEDSVGPYIVCI